MTDETILELYQAAVDGSQIAWHDLYHGIDYRVRSWIVRSGALAINDASIDIDDIAIEAWLRLHKAAAQRKQFTTGSRLLAYLAHCAKSASIDAARSANCRIRPAESVESSYQNVAASPIGHLLLQEAMASLSPVEQLTLQQVLDGVSIQASAIDVAPPAIYQRRLLVYRKLSDAIAEAGTNHRVFAPSTANTDYLDYESEP